MVAPGFTFLRVGLHGRALNMRYTSVLDAVCATCTFAESGLTCSAAMSVIVDLGKVIEALDYPQEWECFLDRHTGRIIAVTEEDAPYIEGTGDGSDIEEAYSDLPTWQRDSILDVQRAMESADLLHLPSKFDFHEWGVMRRFADSQLEPARSRLLDAVHGPGAFRSFRNCIDLLDVRDLWFEFRAGALREFAIDWLKENGIAFSE